MRKRSSRRPRQGSLPIRATTTAHRPRRDGDSAQAVLAARHIACRSTPNGWISGFATAACGRRGRGHTRVAASAQATPESGGQTLWPCGGSQSPLASHIPQQLARSVCQLTEAARGQSIRPRRLGGRPRTAVVISGLAVSRSRETPAKDLIGQALLRKFPIFLISHIFANSWLIKVTNPSRKKRYILLKINKIPTQSRSVHLRCTIGRQFKLIPK
jgi:hypothetical protein